MINEIEKTFFDAFGVEPKFVISLEDWERYKILPRAEELFKHYPQITDHILLELIRIIGLITIKYTNEQCEICYGDGAISYLGKDLKEAILNFLISKVSIFKQQVRTLFEESNNNDR